MEVRGWRHPEPDLLHPHGFVEYVAGSEAALDVYVWFRAHDGRRFAKAANTPSLARTSQEIDLDEMSTRLEEKWAAYFDADLGLTGEEYWVAVTWQAVDKQRYCWMFVQRMDGHESLEFKLAVGAA
jgi:hypothetical protein